MNLRIVVTLDLEEQPPDAALHAAIGSTEFREWNRDVARKLSDDLGMRVNFVICEVGQSFPVEFPIRVRDTTDDF